MRMIMMPDFKMQIAIKRNNRNISFLLKQALYLKIFFSIHILPLNLQSSEGSAESPDNCYTGRMAENRFSTGT